MSKDIHILELAAYEPPVIKESKRENFVEFGEDNDYYSFLISCYTNSTTNNAIINNVSRLIYGKGLSATDANKKPAEYAQMMTLFSKESVRQLCMDLKMLGQCAMQVIYTKDRKKIAAVHHMPVQLLRAEKCNEDGKIEAYYYSDDWTDIKKFPPKRIAAFGSSNDELEIYYVKPYSTGLKYYSLPDYVGATPYCTLEESVAEYLINEVQNGFSGRAVINFNNGQPTQEEQHMIKSKVLNQLTGVHGEKVIISFNNNSESATTVDSMPVNDAPDLYNTLTETCLRKIMLGHQITSPLLFGIASQNGFSSNADELKNSYILFQNMVINPMRQLLTDAFDNVLAYNEISLSLYFEELQPLTPDGDLTKTDEAEQTMNALNSLSPLVANKVLENMTPDEIRALVGLKKGAVPTDINLKKDFSDKEGEQILENLEGEEISDVWELIDERAYNDENTDLDTWIEEAEKKNKSTLQKLADVIKSYPSRSSLLDKSVYKVRYKYTKGLGGSGQSRDFCIKMIQRTNSGVVYRLEDIDKASRAGINRELGHKGQPYDLFKFKGGVNCGHYWNEQLYRLKKKADGTYYEDKALSSSEEVESIPKSYKPRPRGRERAAQTEWSRGDKGHHPNYKG